MLLPSANFADLDRRHASLPEKLIFSLLRPKKARGTSAGKLRFGYAFVSWNDEFNIELIQYDGLTDETYRGARSGPYPGIYPGGQDEAQEDAEDNPLEIEV